MKIVSIVSSARKNGNTARIAGAITKEMASLAQSLGIPMEFITVDLAAEGLKPCRGCRVCFEKGEEFCPCKDSLPVIYGHIMAADGIILASPVYVEDVNGVMKNWIDRMAFNCYRPKLAGKLALCVTTSGVGSSTHSLRTMSTALGVFGVKIFSKINFRTGGLMKDEYIRTRFGKEIKSLAQGFFKAIKNKTNLKPSFGSLTAFCVQQKFWRNVKDPAFFLSRDYWQSNGLLNKGTTFYFPHRTNPVKLYLARLTGKIAALFFI